MGDMGWGHTARSVTEPLLHLKVREGYLTLYITSK